MPIYEFFCEDCNRIYNFFSRRVNIEAKPTCPRCERNLAKMMSRFSRIGKAKEAGEEGLPDIDEAKMERALGDIAGEAENMNEEDPKAMARLMRKFSQKTGLNLGDGMEEALARMEAGEDPEKIEAEMGDLLEGGGEEPFHFGAKKGFKGRKAAPTVDETLYDLE